ncbi:phage holin family protein [Clostridium sp. DJ247]|uniref:phage holin family protein n=1 Tax=Clostridium sp. DJ247 TaxID=2726188 RepID=UPI0016253007|nr:phage holin family protein [Clostridium sp. DJ247]MBC2581640.1 hypothetical protein [Clostridium sp. DJ247]
MSRLYSLAGISFISTIMGVLFNIFGGFQVSGSILIILIATDTILGIKAAIKYRTFASRGVIKFFKKIVLYSTTIITIRLLEIGVVAIIKTDMLSQVMVAFLIMSETISILENLTILGVPIPSNFVSIMINNLKIIGFEKDLKNTISNEKDILEIDEIIKYQLTNFKNNDIRKLLEIKFRTWRTVAQQINDAIDDDDLNKERLYYKVMSLVELSSKEIEYQVKQDKICNECLKEFKNINDSRIEKWLKKIEEICYSDKDIQVKKEELIDSIVVLLYQTMLDAHKTTL